MRKMILTVLAVMACLMFAGCELPEGEPSYMSDATAATTLPVAETVPETVAPTEPAPDEGWMPGDEVWFIEWSEGGGWPYPGVVLDVGESHLIISRGWDTEGEQIMAHLDDCYRTYDEAWSSTGKTVVAGEDCG